VRTSFARKAWLFAGAAPGVTKDLEDLERVLSKELSPDYAFQISSKTGPLATKGALTDLLEDVGDWMRGDSPGLLWIAGHGLVDKVGEHRLLTADIDPELEANSIYRLRELWLTLKRLSGKSELFGVDPVSWTPALSRISVEEGFHVQAET
jgi:hypothetical protein